VTEYVLNQMNSEEVWNDLTINLEKQFVVTAANYIDNKGILAGYGFVVTHAEEVSGVKLVKLKNPWRDTEERKRQEWTGRYSLKDSFWKGANSKLLKKLELGEFYVHIEDFKNTFKTMTITHLLPTMKNSFVEKRNAINKKVYKFNF
jgi:hypothetical protein